MPHWLRFSSSDKTLIQIALGALGLFLVASIGYFFIRLALKRLVRKTPTLADDRILALSDRLLLPLVVLLLTYASFGLLPVADAYKKIGSQALFIVVVLFGAWFFFQVYGFLLGRAVQRRAWLGPAWGGLQLLGGAMIGISAAWLIVTKTVPERGRLGSALHRLIELLLMRGGRVLLVLALLFVAVQFLRMACNRMRVLMEGFAPTIERQKRAHTLSSIVYAVGFSLVLVVGILLVLRELGLDMAPFLATAGIGGLAVGFGAQSLVKDFISGFFVLLEDQVRVGDVVNIAGKGGYVESVGLRIIKLRDFDGSLHIVPNGSISTVTNMTKDFSYYLMTVPVAYKEDVDEVMEALREVGKELRQNSAFATDILDDLEVVGVDNFADSAVEIVVRIKTLPIRQWVVGRELRRRIKKAFDARNIEMPFPHMTLYIGEPKDRSPQPLHVHCVNHRNGGSVSDKEASD